MLRPALARSLARSVGVRAPPPLPKPTLGLLPVIQCAAPTTAASTVRTFTASPPLLKKNKEPKQASDGSSGKGGKNAAAAAAAAAAGGDGPFDFDAHFAALDAELAKIVERLREDLTKLRREGDPAALEALHVVVDKSAGVTVPLRDVAHVVPRGRALAVTVYEAGNVKKVISAIQHANLNLQPVPDTRNPQVVNVPLPPPTRESRDARAEQSSKMMHKAQEAVRGARGTCHKVLQGLKKKRLVRPDDLVKAEKRMEEVVKKRKDETEKVEETYRKSILEG